MDTQTIRFINENLVYLLATPCILTFLLFAWDKHLAYYKRQRVPEALMLFMCLIFGAFGKTGINCFVLITGYYMCQSAITGRKYFRLLGEIYFYKIIIATVFALTVYQPFTLSILIQIILPFTTINKNFKTVQLQQLRES